MAKKTQAEVRAEIEALKEIKPKIRRFSAFGDDHHKSIDTIITVLDRRLREDDIAEWSSDDYSAACEAIEWRNGDSDESLVDGYKHLIISE